MLTITAFKDAAVRIDGGVMRTPFLLSETLSKITGVELWLKLENLQFTGSFKERGALNKLLSLNADERAKGIIAASAGNHAQGVARHGQRLGIDTTIVMPIDSPSVKVSRTEAYGARVILEGRDFTETVAHMHRLHDSEGRTIVHPFDDAAIIAGQGTVALEMLEQGPTLDAVIVPVGGGGLIAGIAAVFRALAPTTEVIGVQSERFPGMIRALDASYPAPPPGASVAEGIAVATPGAITRGYVKALVNDIVAITESDIEDAVALLLQIEKTLAEGAGAAGLAAVTAHPARFRGRRVGVVISGGNIDTRLLTAMLQRSLVRSRQLVRITVSVPDRKGTLAQASQIIADRGGNILDVQHDRIFAPNLGKNSSIAFTVELPEAALLDGILISLAAEGMEPMQTI